MKENIHFVCKKNEDIRELVEAFITEFEPVDKPLYVFEDASTNAYYCECHVQAKKIIELCTIDVPLDPEEQAEYRANREINEKDSAFLKMIEDAKNGRPFSNIVAEYTSSFDADHPLKIVGGQHRIKAIQMALNDGIDEYHGLKVYFQLSVSQRLDVQLISNTNIDVPSDLLDRMMETVDGPQLRDWCQKTGLLEDGKDFSDKKLRGGAFTVREARTFVMNYYQGQSVKDFDAEKTDGIVAKTGGIDETWKQLKSSHPEMWNDESLQKAGVEFARLVNKQREYFSTSKKNTKEFVDKARNYAVLASWSFVAGLLKSNQVRLNRHYGLPENSKKDPLNAEALSRARHKSDPANYRGLGTRTDAKEVGRLIELFNIQAEKGTGIDKAKIDAALSKHFAKQAKLEALKLEEAIK